MNKEKIPTQVFRFAVTNYYEVEHYNATNAFKILKDSIEHPWAFVGGEGLNTTDEIDLGRINLSEQDKLMKKYTTRRDFEDALKFHGGKVLHHRATVRVKAKVITEERKSYRWNRWNTSAVSSIKYLGIKENKGE